MADQPGCFDGDERLDQLSEADAPLERLLAGVDFELFRPDLDHALQRSDRPKGGRPPVDPVLMFKIRVLLALCGMSDEQAEYQVRDRLSVTRFLGLGLDGRVPDRTKSPPPISRQEGHDRLLPPSFHRSGRFFEVSKR